MNFNAIKITGASKKSSLIISVVLVLLLGAALANSGQNTGTGLYSYASAATLASSTPPSVPQNLQAIPGNAQASLSWQVPWNTGGSTITGYKIYRSTSSGTETLLTTTGNVLSYNDAGLTNGVKYFYKATALNSVGESPKSYEVTAIPSGTSGSSVTVPSVPQNLQAIPGNTQTSLSWQAPSNNGGSAITGYKIYRSTSSGTETLLTTTGNVLSYNDAGLTNGITYFYKITALNFVGQSLQSVEASAIPNTSKPLRAIMFAPSISQAQLDMLKSNFQPNDGMIASQLSVITNVQDYTGVQGLKHYILAPRIGPEDPNCGLGPVPSVQDFANQANAVKPKYNIGVILYDDEGWCWTPTIERNNFVASIDQEAQIAHQNGFESGIQPTHDLLLQYYKQVHFSSVDFLLIQFQKYLTTPGSGYNTIDPNYYGQVQDIINTAKAQNPHVTIFLQFNLYWSSVDNIKKAIDYFRPQLEGVSIVNLAPNDSDVRSGVPFINNNTPQNQQAIIQYAHS